MAGGTGSTDPFADALEKLGKSSEQLLKSAEALEKLSRDGGFGGRRRGGKGGGAGDDEREEKDEGHRPRSRLKRAWDDSRMGKAWNDAQDRFRHRFGSEGKNHTGGLGRAGRVGAGGAGLAGAALAFIQALNEMRKMVEGFTTTAIESKRKMAESSGAMASVFANREVKDILRDQKMGDALAPSTAKLADAEAKRKDAGAPFAIAIEKAKDEILAEVNNKVAEFYEWARGIVNKFVELLGGGANWLPALGAGGTGDAFDALTRPGGVVDLAKEIEAEARKRLVVMRDRRNAAKPNRLP